MSTKRSQELRGGQRRRAKMSPQRPQELRGDKFLFLTHLLHVRESERESKKVVGSCGRKPWGGGEGLQF